MAPVMNPGTIARMTAYQDRLAEAERQGAGPFARVFADAPTGIGAHEIDAEARIQCVNDEELRLLGYAREEMVGRPVLEFIVMTETAQRAIGKKLSGEQALKPFVRTFKKKDGSAVALVLLDRQIKNPSGEVVGLRTVMTPAEDAIAG